MQRTLSPAPACTSSSASSTTLYAACFSSFCLPRPPRFSSGLDCPSAPSSKVTQLLHPPQVLGT
jgi:hypothetical protein